MARVDCRNTLPIQGMMMDGDDAQVVFAGSRIGLFFFLPHVSLAQFPQAIRAEIDIKNTDKKERNPNQRMVFRRF